MHNCTVRDAVLAISLAVCLCTACNHPVPKALEEPNPNMLGVKEVREFEPACLGFDTETLYVGGKYGIVLIKFKNEAGSKAFPSPVMLLPHEYSSINRVEVGLGGVWMASEIDGSGGINTYIYNYGLISMVKGTDRATTDFSEDGKVVVVASYNVLDVVDTETGETIIHKEFGRLFEERIEVIPGSHARFARLWKDVNGNSKLLGWWDPIGNKAITCPVKSGGAELKVWRSNAGFRYSHDEDILMANETYVIKRPKDRTHYVILASASLNVLGKLLLPQREIAVQNCHFVGPHGLACVFDDAIEIFDLRTRSRIARVFVGAPSAKDFIVVSDSGFFFGNMSPSIAGAGNARPDAEAVQRALIEGCGFEVSE